MEELKQILADFKWTFENMGTPHTPDHFNIPANAITQLEKIIAASRDKSTEEIKTGCAIIRETMDKIKYHVDGDLQPDMPMLKTMWNMLSQALENIEKPASPPSMPELTDYEIESFEFIHNDVNFIAGFRQGMKEYRGRMRSQCEGLIKQKAVEFADFILKQEWYTSDSKPYHWCRMEEFIMVYKTTEELYEIFNQQVI